MAADHKPSLRRLIAGATFALVLALAWGPPYDLLALGLGSALLGVPEMVRARADAPREFKLWFFASVLCVGTVLIAAAVSEAVDLGRDSRPVLALLLAIPVCYIPRRRDQVTAWWWAAAAVPLLAGARLLASGHAGLTTELLACAFGIVALAGIDQFR
ncbi:MAG: hypothetical protein L0271_15045, partial [Gemmatimonadetes bacterium]|nr:hypothetical protein [Gemmatimonadota bacterium]